LGRRLTIECLFDDGKTFLKSVDLLGKRARLAAEPERDLPNKTMAEKAFSGHKCERFLRMAKMKPKNA
jgi:hypothetical protein